MGDPKELRQLPLSESLDPPRRVSEEVLSTLQQRQKTHGDAWLWSGILLTRLSVDGKLNKLTPKTFTPWLMCLVKLVRLLHTPHEREHWLDIQGYAQLALDGIDSEGKHVHIG